MEKAYQNKVVEDICIICGEYHFYKNCKYTVNSRQILDKLIPTRARLTLPDMLEIRTMATGMHTVVTKAVLAAGTEFGPFIAKKENTLNPFIQFPLKIFSEENFTSTEYYLDTSDETECSWMMFVSPANDVSEQNLICYQKEGDIFFMAIRSIAEGETLKVWYSPYYAIKMQKKILSSEIKKSDNLPESPNKPDLNVLIKEQQKIITKEIWNCKFCYKLEESVIEFAKHLYNHYALRKRKSCQYCKQTFLHIKNYKNHLKLFHNSTVMDMGKTVTDKCYESLIPKGVVELKDNCVGGPLLVDNMLTDGFDNSNLLIQQQDPSSFDMQINDLLEVDTLNLGVDHILNSSIRDFDLLNSDVNRKEEEKDTYICDICLRTCSSLKSITSHLKLHMAKYFCSLCKKVFGRRENLKFHKCNYMYSLKCPKCDKIFYQRKYLIRHVAIVHEKRFSCKDCHKVSYSLHDLKNHLCRNIPEEKRFKYKCSQCSKAYLKQSYLARHLKLHMVNKNQPENKLEKYICSECSETFSSRCAYNRHLTTIHEKLRLYNCRICDKSFGRGDILKNHIMNIHRIGIGEMFNCSECGKQFKNQKTLNVHKSAHNQIGFKCHCGASFMYKNNLQRHNKQFHASPDKFHTGETLVHECPICHNKVKLKRSLQRHIRQKHPEEYKNICLELSAKKVKIDKKRKNKISDEDFDTNQKCMDLQKTIENMDFNIYTCNENLYSGSETIDKFLKESSEQIGALFVDSPKSIEMPSGIGGVNINKLNSKEVCLSMPDLSEGDHEIKLGKNAYILDNGNIVEPEEKTSNVVVYVLSNK